MILAFLIAAGLAIIAITAAMTAVNYGNLPDRVPMHFGFAGDVNNYGPRPMAWMLVAVQIGIAALFASILATWIATPNLARAASGMAAFGDIMLLIMLRAQQLIISTALSGMQKAEMKGFWLFFVCAMAAAIACIAVIPRL